MDVKGGSVPGEENLPTSQMDLLAKLEAANKLIESDAKSLTHSTHSRKNSDTSQVSVSSSKYLEIWNSVNNIIIIQNGYSFFISIIYAI